MRILSFFSRATKEGRASFSKADPKDPVVAKWFSRATSAGVDINDDTALSIPTFYACVKVLSEDMGKLPLYLYRENGDAREKAKDSALYRLLARRPNRWQTPFEFKRQLARNRIMRGNGYAEIVTDRKTGQVSELIPLHPDRVVPFMAPNGKRAYAYQPPGGLARRIILQEEMLHFMGDSDDGVSGRSVLEDGARTLGLAYATMEFGAKFFQNGATPGGVLEHPNTLGDEAMKNLRDSWNTVFQGLSNAHKVAILEEGMKYHPVQLNAEEAQFIESRKLSPVEICQFFRIPPHKVGILDKATFSNIEQQSLEYFQDALLSHLVSFEETADRDLLKTEAEQQTLFFKFDPNILLRADIKSRYEAYRIACGKPWMPPNEVRAKEDMNPIDQDGMDDVGAPLNMLNPGGNPDETKKPPKGE